MATDPSRPPSLGQYVEMTLTDFGSGVDVSSIGLEIDGRVSRVDGKALSYQPQKGLMTLRHQQMSPYPIWYVDGAPLSLKLTGVRDFAGHVMESEPSWRLTTDSPISLSDAGAHQHDGWCTGRPRVRLRPRDRGKFALAWMRTLQGDGYASDGCYVREIAMLPKVKDEPVNAGTTEIPLHTGDRPPVFVAEVKVDTTVPQTEIKTTTALPGQGQLAPTTVQLSHGEYAYRRGGLMGRYYRRDDLKQLIRERVDPSVYFFDDREQFTPPVPGAHSAVWEGGLYVPKTHETELELVIWRRGKASGRALIDGDLILELLPKDMKVVGYKKQRVILTEGMHELRLEFREPRNVEWSFALFRWRKGERGEDVREPFGPKEFYYLQNLGTTYYAGTTAPSRLTPGHSPYCRARTCCDSTRWTRRDTSSRSSAGSSTYPYLPPSQTRRPLHQGPRSRRRMRREIADRRNPLRPEGRHGVARDWERLNSIPAKTGVNL